jgi:hypothetical protein
MNPNGMEPAVMRVVRTGIDNEIKLASEIAIPANIAALLKVSWGTVLTCITSFHSEHSKAIGEKQMSFQT